MFLELIWMDFMLVRGQIAKKRFTLNFLGRAS